MLFIGIIKMIEDVLNAVENFCEIDQNMSILPAREIFLPIYS